MNDYDTDSDDYDDELDVADYGHIFTTIGSFGSMTVDVSNTDHVFNNNSKHGRLPASWILLDNQSTVNVFWNTMFLVNVRKTIKRLNLHTNAGSAIIDEIGELPGFGTIWCFDSEVSVATSSTVIDVESWSLSHLVQE